MQPTHLQQFLPKTPDWPSSTTSTIATPLVGTEEPNEDEFTGYDFTLPQNRGLLNRDNLPNGRGAEAIKARVFGTVAESNVPRPPITHKPQPQLTPEQEAAFHYKRAVTRLSERYARRQQYFEPPFALEYAWSLLTGIADAELATRGRTRSTDKFDESLMADILRYFWRSPDSGLDLNRGLLLHGPVGPGKTFIFDCLQILFEVTAKPAFHFNVVSTKSMLTEVAAKKSFDVLTPYRTGILVMDDMGEEGKISKAYGDARDAIGELLSDRYRLFIREGIPTHFTTNLAPLDLVKLYGPRLEDRFFEWVQSVAYNKPSKRPLPTPSSNGKAQTNH